MRSKIWLALSVVVLFCVGLLIYEGMEKKPIKPRGPIVIAPSPPAIQELRPYLIVPKVIKVEAPKSVISKVKSVMVGNKGIWLAKVNKTTLKAIKAGKLQIRLQVGNVWYNPDNIDEKGNITFAPDWVPPVEGARITMGLFQPTNNFGGGKFVSSVLIQGGT